ncbi:hypothetical protein BC936DRAFT_138927 [Jimgerdemannia flammicorona]|uniref:TNase-like domain-containing protein n=1 Tax=Jimgerdemannia flammicorona TaxID=994334 RepID=A0A433DHZ2_9FUNG|nr:hypothetical protein BC936DRAFT_138927 [Jimgerdemannia flammicorona]
MTTSDSDPRKTLARIARSTIDALSSYLPASVTGSPYFFLGGAVLMGFPVYGLYRTVSVRRYMTAEHIPHTAFERRSRIRGRVVAVGDSDNFRIYHTPRLFSRVPRLESFKGVLMKKTINIRIAGVDAPEPKFKSPSKKPPFTHQSASFSMPAQPFSIEARAWLTKEVLNRDVIVRLLSRDQYQRVVGMAFVRRYPFPFPRRNVSLEMLRAGLATVYTGKGAEYGGILEKLKRAEEMARRERKGMWAQDMTKYTTPAEHKKRHLRGMDL